MEKFKKLFEALGADDKATVAAFKKEFSRSKISAKMDRSLVITIKDERNRRIPNAGKVERVLDSVGCKVKFGSREQTGKKVWQDGDITGCDKTYVSITYTDTAKFDVTTIKIR